MLYWVTVNILKTFDTRLVDISQCVMVEKKQNIFTHLDSVWNPICIAKILGNKEQTCQQNFVFVVHIKFSKGIKPIKQRRRDLVIKSSNRS